MRDILSMMPEELAEVLGELGQPAYRAGQVFGWLHRGAQSFSEMNNLPKGLRDALGERFSLPGMELARRQESKDGTVKLLWTLRDGETVETVRMGYDAGVSACLSTQVGCRQGCGFCASNMGGMKRGLTAGEMMGQVLYGVPEASRVVLMGIGEPLDNYEETLRFLRLLNHPEGRGMSLRHVSLSTCGLVPEIRRLAEEGLSLTLSVSLHASDDETRSRIMPINKTYGLDSLLSACKYFVTRTGRRVSYEYVMIQGVNDTPEAAKRLAALLRGHPAHVNLIALNPVAGKSWRSPEAGAIRAFAGLLEDKGATVTVRRRLGADIDAACGQLRRAAAQNGRDVQDVRRENEGCEA